MTDIYIKSNKEPLIYNIYFSGTTQDNLIKFCKENELTSPIPEWAESVDRIEFTENTPKEEWELLYKFADDFYSSPKYMEWQESDLNSIKIASLIADIIKNL
jgi:hypothetical protein